MPRIEGEILESFNLKVFSFAQLMSSMRNFGPYSVLGKVVLVRFLKGHLTAKSDIYSFKIVLPKMLSGRRAIDKT
ncbi:Probable serine/threonine-protein kinase PBL9 [Linum perenne]